MVIAGYHVEVMIIFPFYHCCIENFFLIETCAKRERYFFPSKKD